MNTATLQRLPLQKTLSFALAFLALSLAACEGPAGPEGPEGPEGPQGPPGAANVEVAVFNVNASDFTDSGQTETATYTASIITSDVVSGGAVLGFLDLPGGSTQWMGMPFTLPVDADLTVAVNFGYSPGEFGVFLNRPEGYSPVASAFDGASVKVVAIPPSEAANAANAGAYESYEDAADALGLADE